METVQSLGVAVVITLLHHNGVGVEIRTHDGRILHIDGVVADAHILLLFALDHHSLIRLLGLSLLSLLLGFHLFSSLQARFLAGDSCFLLLFSVGS